MKNSNWILIIIAITLIGYLTGIYLGNEDKSTYLQYCILCSAWAIVKELEKLNEK